MLKVRFERQNQHYRRIVRYPDETVAVEDHVMLQPRWYEPVSEPNGSPRNSYFPEKAATVGQEIAEALLGRHGIRFLEENWEQEHRIVICEDPDLPEISRVPWELAAVADRFLLIHRLIPIIRQPQAVKVRKELTIRQPPRVLVLSALFTGQSRPVPENQLQKNQLQKNQLLENQLTTLALTLGELEAHGYVEVEEVLDCTREKLNRLLSANRYDIVCFTGNGYFDEGKNTGGLVLETPGGEPDPVSANDLVFYFREQKELPLVFLNCCNGGIRDEVNSDGFRGFLGVARRLPAGGIPEVVVTEAAGYESPARIVIKTLFEELAMDPGFNVAKALTTARCAVETRPEQFHDFYRFLHYSAIEEDVEISVMESDEKSDKKDPEDRGGDLKQVNLSGYTKRACLLNRGGVFRNLPEPLQFDLFRAAGTHPFMINCVVNYLLATPRLPETITGEAVVLESIRRILPQLSPEQIKTLKALLPEELYRLLK